MPMQMPMEVSNEHVNSANSQKLNRTTQNYFDQAQPMSEGTTDTNLISRKNDQIGSETSNSQQKRARQRKQSTNNIQRTEFINELGGSFSFTLKTASGSTVKQIEKQSDQRTESVDQNIEVPKQTNLPLDAISAHAKTVISQKANQNTKIDADQTRSMPERATANDQNIEVPKQTNFPLDLIKANAKTVISQKANQNTKVNAVQTHSMSERTSAKLKTVKSDQSSKKKFQVDPKIKKTGQIDQQTTKIQRKSGMPKIKSLSQIYQSDSVTTSTKEANSTDQKSYKGPKSQQNDKQSDLIVTKSNNHIDQSNFARTNDQQMDEMSELSQMVQLVIDDLMCPQHEEDDMMSNDKPILMPKKDLRADQSIYEESPSRKRGRPKKEKIEEKKPKDKPKIVKQNSLPKSAIEVLLITWVNF
ncbi:hypothetical protein niasHT_004489 [Heterodera trifolii]|uniref:Uncharacterized protein n=1 Tax=Heterodera trifolii TaxID=157864 RepID=A0ABD2MDF0_9BILA